MSKILLVVAIVVKIIIRGNWLKNNGSILSHTGLLSSLKEGQEIAVKYHISEKRV